MRVLRKYGRRLLLAVVLAALLVFGVLMYGKVSELTNRLTYLQDTMNIILSDVDGMQSGIEQTLEQEASMMESYTIDVTDMDFASNTYDVKISVIPKEYTDSTKVSIYFGTTECELAQDGYLYTGTATLPLSKTFDGNVTFLLADGKKKTTEVVQDFEGLSGKFDEVLTGSLAGSPSLKKGVVAMDGICTYALDGTGLYEFEILSAVAELDGVEIWKLDLPETDGASEQTEGDTAQTTMDGSAELDFTYELPQEESESEDSTETGSEEPAEHTLRIFLRAVTSDGYRFETQLREEMLLDEESVDSAMRQYVYDRRGNCLEVP